MEKGAKQVTLSEIERIMGVVGKKQAACETHGEYQSMRFRREGQDDRWSDCPACADERRAEQEEVERREAQEAARKRRQEEIMKMAAIPPRFEDSSLSGYHVEPGRDLQALALRICREYAERFDQIRGFNLYMAGSVGTGKTHLATAIANHVMQHHGASVQYLKALSMFRRLKATFNPRSQETEDEVIRALAGLDLLIIDEIGLGHDSNTEVMHLAEVIDERYLNLRPTIMIGNQRSPQEVKDAIGERVYDRMMERGKVLLLNWDSYRQKQD